MSIEVNINHEKEILEELSSLKGQIKHEALISWKDPIRIEKDGRKWVWNPERRPWYQYDEKWFVKWNHPFADIKNPYSWKNAYSVYNQPRSRILPNLSYKDLWKSWLEWPLKTLSVRNFSKDFIPTHSIWVKVNNPCDVSCGSGSVHAVWLIDSKGIQAGDGQWLAKYKNPVYWLASHMKMIRDFKFNWDYLYRNRSIQWVICNWQQWFYSKDEDKSLKALRLCWISDACNKINKNSKTKIQRFDRIKVTDKETLMAFTQLTAENETWCQFTRATLEKAYKLAFG